MKMQIKSKLIKQTFSSSSPSRLALDEIFAES